MRKETANSSRNALIFHIPFSVILLLTALSTPQTTRAQIFRLPHADTTAGTFFGVAVAVDGGRVLVGASGEASCAEDGGAAYVFERQPDDTWAQAARLVASDCEADHFFGRSVSLSGDRALVAASGEFFSTRGSNKAYVFERRSDGTWEEVARLVGDPETVEGAFASSVDLDGDRALITTSGDASRGAYGGAAYVFERKADGTWRQTARLVPSRPTDGTVFGGTGVIDGNRAAVAASTYFAHRPGAVYVFERDPATGAWAEAARFGEIDDFFISLDLDEDRLLVGESKEGRHQTGAASLFVRDPAGHWRHDRTFRPKAPYEFGAFGSAVALDDEHALIVGYDEQLGLDVNIDRVVYVFEQTAEGDWAQRPAIDVGAVAFGAAVALDEPLAVVGRAADDEPGAAYVVRLR